MQQVVLTVGTELSTYNLLAASVLAVTVSTPCILPVPSKVIPPPETVKLDKKVIAMKIEFLQIYELN